MSLSDWLKSAWLVEHESSQQEIADLLSVIDRDLQDCRSRGLSADWMMAIAYNAALQVAIAALAAEGYRVARESHHFRAFCADLTTNFCSDEKSTPVAVFENVLLPRLRGTRSWVQTAVFSLHAPALSISPV